MYAESLTRQGPFCTVRNHIWNKQCKDYLLCVGILGENAVHAPRVQPRHPIVSLGSAARGLSNAASAFIFISCSGDFLSLGLRRHLVLWTSHGGEWGGCLLRRKDEKFACGARDGGTQTGRKGRKEEKVRVRSRRDVRVTDVRHKSSQAQR